MMNTALRVLMVEDSEADARLVLLELQQCGYEPQSRRVETAAELTAALAAQEWDVVICDFRLPRFTALAALELVRASGLDLPFILVSGSVGEEQAVAMMKAGAHDFLLKDRLARLAPAVSRELGDAEARRQRRQAVEELGRTNEKLQGILNSITDGLAVLDRNWCFTYFSEQAAKILGKRPEQLLGGCLWELFPHTRDTKHHEEYHRAVETGQPAHFEDYFPEPFNIWLECHCYPSDEGLSVYFRDITRRKQAAELVARQAAELATLHATAPVGLFFFDTELRFVRVNREMAELNGLPAEQHIGRTLRELLTPELADSVEPLLRQVIETGRPVLEYEVHGATAPRADETNRHWLVSYHPVLAEDGTIRGVHGVVVEITKRKEVEDALLASEAAERARRQELEALMDALPVGIIIARDANSLHMTANRAAEELLRLPHGQNPSQSAAHAERPDFQVWSDGHRLTPDELPMQRATATGQPVSGAEFEIVFPDGESKALLCSAFPIFHESGVVRGCIGAFVDITVPKRRELNLTFLAETQKSLASTSNPLDIMRLAGGRIAEHLHLDHCLFVEINEAADEATVLHDHQVGDGPGFEGSYHLKDFHTDDELRKMAAGRMVVIGDVSHHPRPAASSERFKALGIGSLANASHVADGRWEFMLSAIRSKPGEWPPEDNELLAELVERIHLRLERARAEERLSDSETRFRSIFHDAAVPMEVSLPDGRFTQVNRAFCELLGYSAEELLEMKFDSIAYPEDRTSPAREPLQYLMDRTMTGFRAEKRYIRKDGLVVWVDLSVSVVRDADGRPLYFIGQVQDITGRKQAEASLRKSENMLALAIDAGQLGIWNWDQFTRTLVWSERCNEMTGLPRGSEISPETAIGTTHPEDRERVQAEAMLALEMQTDIELEYRTLWPDGSVRWLQTRGRAIYDAAGKLVRITGIIQDVTERRESEEALRRFNTQLESLVDARTEVIKMTMKELQREFAERRRLEEEILDIGERAQARIGQDLHDDLGQQLVGMTILMGLLSSHLGAESHPRAAEAARLQTFLTGIINTTRNLAKSLYPVELERGGLNLSLQELAIRTEMMAGVTCLLSADERFQFEKAVEIHLYRIAQESISNALKHGKARNIVIDCSVEDGVSTLTVTDDGSGFERPEEGKWTGIGLHLFQYRARLIGAHLTVTRGNNGGCQVRCSIGEPRTAGMQSLQT
jgi:PAS domain S-box-containing protein